MSKAKTALDAPSISSSPPSSLTSNDIPDSSAEKTVLDAGKDQYVSGVRLQQGRSSDNEEIIMSTL